MGLFTELGKILGEPLIAMAPTAHEWGLKAFGLLALLTIVWTGIRIMLGAEPDGIVTLARRMFGLAILFTLAVLARQITSLALNSAQDLATALQAAGGVAEPVVFHKPSTVIESFGAVMTAAGTKTGGLFSWGILTASIPMLFGVIVLWIAQLIFAVTMLRYLLEAYLVQVLVPVLAGFAGWSGTAGLAEAGWGYLLRFSVRLVVVLLVVSMAPAVANSLVSFIADTGLKTWSQTFAAAGTSFAFAIIAPGLPALVGRGMANISVPLRDLLR